MAQRTLRRLKKARRVVAKIAPDGATVYALGRGGARYLKEREDLDAKTTSDGMRTLANYIHRSRANRKPLTSAAGKGLFFWLNVAAMWQ